MNKRYTVSRSEEGDIEVSFLDKKIELDYFLLIIYREFENIPFKGVRVDFKKRTATYSHQ